MIYHYIYHQRKAIIRYSKINRNFEASYCRHGASLVDFKILANLNLCKRDTDEWADTNGKQFEDIVNCDTYLILVDDNGYVYYFDL